MIKKKLKTAGIATALLGSAVMCPTALAAAAPAATDVVDAGSWLQVVGEGNLKSLDPRSLSDLFSNYLILMSLMFFDLKITLLKS